MESYLLTFEAVASPTATKTGGGEEGGGVVVSNQCLECGSLLPVNYSFPRQSSRQMSSVSCFTTGSAVYCGRKFFCHCRSHLEQSTQENKNTTTDPWLLCQTQETAGSFVCHRIGHGQFSEGPV